MNLKIPELAVKFFLHVHIIILNVSVPTSVTMTVLWIEYKSGSNSFTFTIDQQLVALHRTKLSYFPTEKWRYSGIFYIVVIVYDSHLLIAAT